MKKATIVITAILLSVLLTACASKQTIKSGEADVKKLVNCATAEGDIRALNSEKVHARQQLAAGVTAIVPIGLVVNVAEGTEGSQARWQPVITTRCWMTRLLRLNRNVAYNRHNV